MNVTWYLLAKHSIIWH